MLTTPHLLFCAVFDTADLGGGVWDSFSDAQARVPEASGEDNLTHGFNLLSLAACEASKLVDSRAVAEI